MFLWLAALFTLLTQGTDALVKFLLSFANKAS